MLLYGSRCAEGEDAAQRESFFTNARRAKNIYEIFYAKFDSVHVGSGRPSAGVRDQGCDRRVTGSRTDWENVVRGK